jgi:hypothetical protein
MDLQGFRATVYGVDAAARGPCQRRCQRSGQSRGLRTSPFVFVCTLSALVFTGQVAAAPPVLTSVSHVDRHPSATWTLPPGVVPQVAEVATSPATSTDGYFFSENVVAFDLLQRGQTNWVYNSQLDPGTYYAHISGLDEPCFYAGLCPVREFTQILTLTIAAPPPPPPPPAPRPRYEASVRSIHPGAIRLSGNWTYLGDTVRVRFRNARARPADGRPRAGRRRARVEGVPDDRRGRARGGGRLLSGVRGARVRYRRRPMIEATALVIALAALVFSVISFYMASLSPAEIEIDHIPRGEDELPSGAFSGPHPQSNELILAAFISNVGARGGLLDDVRVTALEWLGGGESFWIDVESTALFREPRRDALVAIKLPLAFEAGDVNAAFLMAYLQQAPLGPEDQARRIGTMTSVAVTIRWAFFRTSGLPVRWRIVPDRFKRSRERVERSTRVEVDVFAYRTRTIEYWRGVPQYVHLAELAEGDA